MKKKVHFEWSESKEKQNEKKHGMSFSFAQLVFLDKHRIILEDLSHSHKEKRFYCIGKVAEGIITVRFTYRSKKIRVIGAGYWRKGKKLYERENKI